MLPGHKPRLKVIVKVEHLFPFLPLFVVICVQALPLLLLIEFGFREPLRVRSVRHLLRRYNSALPLRRWRTYIIIILSKFWLSSFRHAAQLMLAYLFDSADSFGLQFGALVLRCGFVHILWRKRHHNFVVKHVLNDATGVVVDGWSGSNRWWARGRPLWLLLKMSRQLYNLLKAINRWRNCRRWRNYVWIILCY